MCAYLMTGSPYDGGEHGPRGVVSGETRLAHPRSIVNDQSCNIIICHFDL